MVTTASMRIREEKTNMRGGDGTVFLDSYIDKALYPDHFRVFSEIILNPGCSIGDHVHNGECEVFLILEGEGIYNDNGVKKDVYPGDTAVCFDGEAHGIENRSDKPLRLFAAVITK